jgi:predicted DNA-binding antitoxin AbrB/MazE fold protein
LARPRFSGGRRSDRLSPFGVKIRCATGSHATPPYRLLEWSEGGEHGADHEAIYTQGVLKPAAELNLREQQRIRVIVEPIEVPVVDRDAALARLKAGIATMKCHSNYENTIDSSAMRTYRPFCAWRK